MKPFVLIVEDDAGIKDSLETALRVKGLNTGSRETLVPEELEPAPDLILLDVSLCGTSGKEICTTLKKNPATAHIPVLMMSASSSQQAACMAAGANDFITKPFRLSDLINRIYNLI